VDALGILPAIVAAGLVAAAVLIRVARSDVNKTLDRASHDRIARRVAEIWRRPPDSQEQVITPSLGRGSTADAMSSRHRLWRDSSVVLVVLGAGLAMILAISAGRPPTGLVLGATATPGAEQPSDTLSTSVTGDLPVVATSIPVASLRTFSPTPAPTARPSDSPRPVTSERPATEPPPPPQARTDRLSVLTPCPNHPDCFSYTVRQGDNLSSIANWFGIPYSTVLSLNPQIRDPRNLYAGEQIRLPAPRR
jgi:LysM domain.